MMHDSEIKYLHEIHAIQSCCKDISVSIVHGLVIEFALCYKYKINSIISNMAKYNGCHNGNSLMN